MAPYCRQRCVGCAYVGPQHPPLHQWHRVARLRPQVSERQLTTAKKLQLTHRIVMCALQAVTRVMNSRVTQDIASKCRGKHTGELIDVGTPEHTAWDFVEACFPLHGASVACLAWPRSGPHRAESVFVGVSYPIRDVVRHGRC